MAQSFMLELPKLSEKPEHAHPAVDDEMPARLPKDFVWSSVGTKHVDYPPGKRFEGDVATVGRSGYLGAGGFGSVTAVVCKGQLLARKRMHFAKLDSDCKREAEILEDILHPHIIQLIGSYTCQARFYLLLHPVAECNLKEFIQIPEEQRTSTWEDSMKEAFGCLAAAVAFLHSKKIAVKHKDIKPSNVLMCCGTPMLTDFGLSNSFKGKEDSLSSGTTGKTALYAAPEVIAELPRGSSQDVFSLGLVFQDMYWALHGHSQGHAMDSEGNHREGPWDGNTLSNEELAFSKDLPKLAFDWAPQLREKLSFTKLIHVMTAKRPTDRPAALTVWKCLMVPSYYGRMCGKCCHEKLRLYEKECKDQNGWTRMSKESTSTTISPNASDKTYPMLQLSNSPPYDNSGAAYRSCVSTHEPSLETAPPQSEYEQLLADRGFLPRLDDDFNWSGRGMHVEYGINDTVPLQAESIIGHTAQAIIEAVRCRRILLARKSIRMSRRTRVETIVSEIGFLRNIRHRHVVQLIGSYMQRRTLSILQYPVANYNLGEFMESTYELGEPARQDRIALKRFFSCLAQAVEYIHDQLVKHMDIKPQNILVRHPAVSGAGAFAQVYLADFGISRQYAQEEEAETSGPTTFTRRYAAPEVVLQEARGFAADIFSLGCVFLEMQTVVLGPTFCTLDMLLRGDEYGDTAYSSNPDKIVKWIEQLGNHPRSLDGLHISQRETRTRLRTLSAMLDMNPVNRPTAVAIAMQFGSNECCHLDREEIANDNQAEISD